jgi:P-type E1-E2 ATPase
VALGTVAVAAAIGAYNVVVWQQTILETFFLTIALAVAAIPEGLPVAMTVALAVASTRMAARKVIVRRLTAVEGLGSCTLIATDKTGTLTCNELTIRELSLPDGRQMQVTGEGFAGVGQILHQGEPVDPQVDRPLRALLTVGVLCNEAELHDR